MPLPYTLPLKPILFYHILQKNSTFFVNLSSFETITFETITLSRSVSFTSHLFFHISISKYNNTTYLMNAKSAMQKNIA